MTSARAIRNLAVCSITSILMYACVEPFEAEVSASQLDILIIDGYINIGSGKTQILLSKVSGINEPDVKKYEEGADVRIENGEGEAFLLNESGNGVYTSSELSLPIDKQYRLYIKLLNGKEFHSEFQTPKVTPQIDSVHWEFKPDLLYIYANTHDATGASRYYRWSYKEDWQIKTPYKADLLYGGGISINERSDPWMLSMHNCWKKAESRGLIFGSTTLLSEDRINFPVVTIPHNSEKTDVKYSVIIDQHTITEDEFNYLTLMNKNTTQTGSFFDPMPSQLFGNIKRVNDSKEMVIGYVGVYTTVRDTLFIEAAELPAGNGFQLTCHPLEFERTPENCERYLGGDPPPYIPHKLYDFNGDPEKPMVVAYPTKDCMDCRSNSTVGRPDFWRPNAR